MAKKKKQKASNVKDVLKQIPEKELLKFLAKELDIQELLDDFMSEFQKYFLKGGSGEAYVNQIDSAFIDAEGDYGYINFHEQSHLASVVSEALEAAGHFRDNGNYEAAIDICFCALENGADAVNHSDDSMGYLGSIMRESIQVLCSLANPDVSKLDDYNRLEFMDRCWACIEDKNFKGWDWYTVMYDFLVGLANCAEEYEDIMEALDDDEVFKSDYRQHELMHLKKALLLKWKGEDAARQLVHSNLHIKEFREKALEEAVSANDLQRAYKLALDGIEQDKKNAPGIVPTWNHWMLRIAQKEGNYDLTVKYASQLYLHPLYETGDFYKLLKQTIPADQWTAFAENLARQAIDMGCDRIYADICSREKWLDRLMAYVKKQKSIHTLKKFESQLLRDYRAEIIDIYIRYAEGLMSCSYNRNRNTYKEMCSHLKHAVKLGGHDKVEASVVMLREKYKRSRALLEELNSVCSLHFPDISSTKPT